MAGFLTDHANNKLLDQVFGGAAFSPPAVLYLGLSKLAASKSGGVSEPVGGGYSRASVSNVIAQFPLSSGGTKTNANAITFPIPSADWGTILSVFVADAAAGGNVLASADLPAPKPIAAGAPAPIIASGALFLSHT